MNTKTLSFLRSIYKEYYFKNANKIEFPSAIEEREFGYTPFGGGMVRHISFRSNGEAMAEIIRQAPASIYCSNARYDYPTLPMDEKGWKGAELIFDIDADDIFTRCKKTHNFWFCSSCFTVGRLPRPALCPRCKFGTDEFHGTCTTCLSATKDHAQRVIDFLVNDFGTKAHDIATHFSGSRGYHLHVYDERFYYLDSVPRAEICDYFRGVSLPPSQSIVSVLRRTASPTGIHAGWMARIMKFIGEANRLNVSQKIVNQAIAAHVAMVDPSVTTDIHRVFRLAGTLHGSSGMLKKRVYSFDNFHPDFDPVVLGEENVKLKVSYYPRFTLKGRDFGPFKNEEVAIPEYAAINILTRGLGEVL